MEVRVPRSRAPVLRYAMLPRRRDSTFEARARVAEPPPHETEHAGQSEKEPESGTGSLSGCRQLAVSGWLPFIPLGSWGSLSGLAVGRWRLVAVYTTW